MNNKYIHLVNNLHTLSIENAKKEFRIRVKNEIFDTNDYYKKWIEENLLGNTRLIVEPKIIGESIVLVYQEGSLRKAFHRSYSISIEILKSTNIIPLSIPIKKDIMIRGQLYSNNLNPETCKNFISNYLKNKTIHLPQLKLCCFQIINSTLNHLSELTELKKLLFEIPENEYTRLNVNEVDLYKDLWSEGKLFKSYPTNGIIIKVNSKRLQRQLGEIDGYVNWAYALC